MRLQLCFFFWYVTVRFSLALILIRYGHQLRRVHSGHTRERLNALQTLTWMLSSGQFPPSTGQEYFYQTLDDCFDWNLDACDSFTGRQLVRGRRISIIRVFNKDF